MSSVNASPEKGGGSLVSIEGETQAPEVFQPQKLTEIVEMIDLMGKISERVGEDRSGDTGNMGSGQAGTQTGQQTGSSTRDEQIATIPAMPVMQQKLVSHIRSEIAQMNREARKLAKSNRKGSAFLLTEIYKNIRRLSSLISEILEASADVIRRFYIALFIDKQSISGALPDRSDR